MLALATLCTSFVLSAPAHAATPATFVFTGSGWGHGVGLSQYGALEQAADGRNWRQILGHYYSGTSIGGGAPSAVRVMLTEGLEQFGVEGTGAFRFRSGSVTVASSAGGDGWWTVRPQPQGAFTIYRPNGVPAAPPVTASQPLIIEYEPWSTIVRAAATGARYRWGRIELTAPGNRVRAVLQITLEQYLRGIAEVPSSWPFEALNAQAVAARTYAANRAFRLGHRRPGCDCTLYADTRDQVYRGYEREDPAVPGTSRWVGAVQATAGNIVRWGGEPILASYHSSSGGRTEASRDVWGADLPYLQPVADPWSMRPSNPFASWEARLTQQEVAARVGLERVDAVEIGSRTAGGGVGSAVIRGDRTISLGGGQLRSMLGLRSTKFNVAASVVSVWTRWTRVQPNDGANPQDNPALAATPDGAVHAFITGRSTVPYAARRDPATGRWSRWERVGSASSAGFEPAVVADRHGWVHAVIRGRSGNIWTARRDPGTGRWSSWARIGNSGSRGSKPRLAASPDGAVWLVIQGQSPTAYASRWDPVARRWSGWGRVGSDAHDPAVATTSAGLVVVAARGADLAVKASVYDGRWSPWSQVSGGFGHSPAMTSGGGSVLLVVRGRSGNQLFAARLGAQGWSGWARVPGGVTASGASPSAVMDVNGVSHVFFRGSGDGVYTATRSPAGVWAQTLRIGAGSNVTGAGANIAAAAAGRFVHGLVRGRNAGLYTSHRPS